jgi:hypothetical protein
MIFIDFMAKIILRHIKYIKDVYDGDFVAKYQEHN